jgi:hypothetical protein
MHYDDSALRRSLDEPGDPALLAHLESCPPCRARRDALAADAAFAGRLFAQSPPAADANAAFARLSRTRFAGRAFPVWTPGAIGLAAAACLAALLAFTPLGGYAGQLLTIFEPTQIVPIEISARDSEQLRLMPDLQRFGTFAAGRRPPARRVASLAGVQKTLGFEPRSFDVPSGSWRARGTFVQMPFTTSYTFSAKKARTYEARFGRTLPAMPPGLDGTTFRATYGPMLVRYYCTANESPCRNASGMRRGELDDAFAFVESKAPVVTSTGATLDEAANYLLSMPNVPPGVAQQLRAIADPAHTLPIPLATDKKRATPVSVDGVRGLSIGDETGLGSAVIWEKGGMIYVVGGSLKESEALALAARVK